MGRRHWLALARYLRYYRISAMVKSGLYDAHRPSVKRLLSSVNDTKYFLFEGNAMLPTIGPGYTLLEARVRPALRRLYKGDVVVVEHPDSPTDIMVRRLTAMSGDLLVSDKDLPTYRLPPNHYWVSCDNEEATFDSRTYGPLHSSHILGRVVHTVASDGRALARVMNSPQGKVCADIPDKMGNILSSQPTETPFPSPLPNPTDPHVKKQSVVVEGTGTWGSGIHRCPEAADRLIGVEDPYMATLYDNFRLGVTKYPDSACLGQRKMVDGQAGDYVFVTYKTVAQWITEVGSALRHVGVQKGANVGIYSKNKTEWVVIEQACNAYTHPTVAVYDTFGPDAVHFVMKHSEMPIVFLEKDKVPALASSIAMGLPTLKYAVVFETVTEDDVAKFAASGVRLMTYSDFRAMGRENPHPHEPPRSSDIAIIMYTSGTTGDPKGVILTHGNMVSTLNSVEERIRVVSEDVHLSFLPLAHCFERIVQAKFFRAGGRIGFYQGDVRKLPDDIKCLQPTIFVGVPRVFNRFYDKVLQTVNQGSTVTQTLYHTAYSYRKNALSNGQDTPWYNTLLFNKFRAALGGRVRLIITGSAPLDVRVHEWLRVCMCPLVLQGYGLTETCAGSSVLLTNDLAVGSCGGPIGCNEFKLVDVPEMDYRTTDNPPRGEVWIRGTNVFQGYYKDAEKTRADLDEEGWFHTGDVGRWNDDGSLSIIDRKKNIFKLAQGEYIAAEQLEMIYASAPHVAQVYVYGDSLKTFLLAVVVPDQEQLMPWAQEKGITGDFREVCAHPEVKTLLMAEMNAEAKKAKLKGFEYVKGIVVYGELFSVENNLLTPTFKIKRPAAVKFFKEQFNQLYEEVEKSMAEK